MFKLSRSVVLFLLITSSTIISTPVWSFCTAKTIAKISCGLFGLSAIGLVTITGPLTIGYYFDTWRLGCDQNSTYTRLVEESYKVPCGACTMTDKITHHCPTSCYAISRFCVDANQSKIPAQHISNPDYWTTLWALIWTDIVLAGTAVTGCCGAIGANCYLNLPDFGDDDDELSETENKAKDFPLSEIPSEIRDFTGVQSDEDKKEEI